MEDEKLCRAKGRSWALRTTNPSYWKSWREPPRDKVAGGGVTQNSGPVTLALGVGTLSLEQ
jgi:hypothetical protein